MHNIRKINEDLYYIGVSDRKIALFENVYPVSEGMSYNSYFLDDEKTVLFDTVDKTCAGQFFDNLEEILKSRPLDYIVINHLEPDHSALIKDVIEKYPNIKIICNQKAKQMLYQFFEFENDIENNFHVVKEGDTIKIGKHTLSFFMAPMVHWPETMVTFDEYSKTLFSADAFGAFGAVNGNLFDDETDFICKIGEYRRYYSNIVGKYGIQVNSLLNKAKNLDIKMICPLHGLIIKENISLLVEKYSLWANYLPEDNSIVIAYASVYGGTQNAVEILANKLSQAGVKNIKMYDVSHTDNSYIISEIFRCSKVVLASTTYNNSIFVKMEHLIKDIINHNVQRRKFAIIENGSWACCCGELIKQMLSSLKNVEFIEDKINIKSALKKVQESDIDEMVKCLI